MLDVKPSNFSLINLIGLHFDDLKDCNLLFKKKKGTKIKARDIYPCFTNPNNYHVFISYLGHKTFSLWNLAAFPTWNIVFAIIKLSSSHFFGEKKKKITALVLCFYLLLWKWYPCQKDLFQVYLKLIYPEWVKVLHLPGNYPWVGRGEEKT